jgi:hypothetical protein
MYLKSNMLEVFAGSNIISVELASEEEKIMAWKFFNLL